MFRSARCEAGLLGRADGSAKWTQGGTEIVVGVYGPRQTIASIEDAEKAAVQVTYSPKSGHAGTLIQHNNLQRCKDHSVESVCGLPPPPLVS